MANSFEVELIGQSFVLPSSNAPQRLNLANRTCLSFDDTTPENAISQPFQVPSAYTGTGVLKADIYYWMASSNSGKVDFNIAVESVSAGDALNMNSESSFDTNNTADQTVPASSGNLGIITATLSNKDSMAVSDALRIRLERDATDATNDTASGDCRVWFVVIREDV